MKIGRIILLLALVLYVASYFPIAVHDTASSASGMKGYTCALLTLTSPWGHEGMTVLHDDPVYYFAVLFSGWINPLFLITLAIRWWKPRAAWVLGAIVLLMFPACWVVFVKAHLRPSLGYFLWSAAMIAALFSAALARARRDQTAVAAR